MEADDDEGGEPSWNGSERACLGGKLQDSGRNLSGGDDEASPKARKKMEQHKSRF
jgi:hypothetical protein